MDKPTTYILNLIEQKIKNDSHCNKFIIQCLPDMDFDRELVIKHISSREGWNDNFSFNYNSDLPWTSVSDEFSRERNGYIIIVKK